MHHQLRVATALVLASATLAGASGCHGPPQAVGASDRGGDTARDGGIDIDLPSADAGVDASELPLSLSAGDQGHAEVGSVLAPGAVRAGAVTAEEQLLSGIKVEGRVGDYKIYNDRVAFIVAGVRDTDGYNPHGGKLLDAQRVDSPAAESLLGETIIAAGASVVRATSVGVVSDGSDGAPALVRTIGQLSLFPLVHGVMPSLAAVDLPLHAVIDHVLRPDSEALEIHLRLFNKRADAAVRVPLSVLALLAGDGVFFFTEGAGFDVEAVAGGSQYLAAVGERVGYATVGVDATLDPLLTLSGIWVISTGAFDVPAAGEAGRRYDLLVAPGTPDGLLGALRRHRGQTDPPAVQGTVHDTSGAPVAGASIHVRRPGAGCDYVSGTRSDDQGRYRMALATGSYAVTVVGPAAGVRADAELTVGAGGANMDLVLPRAGRVRFEARDGDGASIPAKLAFRPAASLPELPACFGQATLNGRKAEIVFHTGGPGEVRLAPGSYTVIGSRGFEHEVDSQALELAAGGELDIALQLPRTVDTSGYLCGDFHLHGMRSPDSDDPYELKAAAIAAEGLDLAVITDHDYVADLGPAIASLGLQQWTRGIVGEELTTVAFGHFNPFPITAHPGRPNMGAVRWWGLTPSELFGLVRATWPDAVLQVNHPRSHALSGYFTYVDYDPLTGGVDVLDHWTSDFDAVEVFNNSGWQANRDGTVRDWFSLLDRGLLVTATGNSDSHHAYRHEVGYPRNYVRLSTAAPASVDLAELAEAIKGQAVVVSGGAFIRASVGDRTVGEIAPAPGGKARLAIEVQAPTWVALDTLQVFASGGEKIFESTLDAATAKPDDPVVRFDQAIDVSAEVDTWLVVVVSGAGTLDPVVPGKRPFAVSNPIYLDVDGNGAYDPPASFSF